MTTPSTRQVQQFWEQNPLAAAGIAAEPGTRGFYAEFNRLREEVEPLGFQDSFYRFADYRGKRVCEVGCGNGYLLSRYAEHGAIVTGVDLTERAVELSRRRFELYGLPGTFVQGNAEQLPLRDGSFDLVLSMGVLHHVPDIHRAVSEIRRVVEPGGTFLMMVYHRNSAAYRLVFPLEVTLRKVNRGKSLQDMVNQVDGLGNPLGRVYSRRELHGLLAGFRITETDVRLFELFLGGRVRRALARLPVVVQEALGRRAGWFLYARAERSTDPR